MLILVVEDEHKHAEFVTKALEEDYYTVEVAATGTDALQKIEVRDYDLIVLDLNLPGISGADLIKRMRELGLYTPILIMTAQDDIQAKVRHLDLGADDYITKPFSIDELLARVRALLRREKVALPTTFVRGDLELRYSTREVAIRGKVIKLTKNEFRILDFITRRPNRVCTRAMLQEHVWGYNTEHKSNVIEATVYNLRKKLGPYKDLIQTVQNIGYRLKNDSTQ
jgi:DNA-binding response OmpR family regulator